jgi:hypothetical protein
MKYPSISYIPPISYEKSPYPPGIFGQIPKPHHLGARFWKDCERRWNRSLGGFGMRFFSGFGSVKMGMGMHFSYEASNYPLVN